METKVKRVVLDNRTQYKLMQLVEAEYKASGLGDTEFAVLAEEQLELKVNHRHVAGARKALDIPSNKPRNAVSAGGAPSTPEVEALWLATTESAKKIADLELRVRLLVEYAQQDAKERGLKFRLADLHPSAH